MANSKNTSSNSDGIVSGIVTTVNNETKTIAKISKPVVDRFYPKDFLQVMIGASVLAIPVLLTDETWRLGSVIPWINVTAIITLSLVFVSLFTYFHYYKNNLKGNWVAFIHRTLTSYFAALCVVTGFALILGLSTIPLQELDVKVLIITCLPAVMAAVVADVLK